MAWYDIIAQWFRKKKKEGYVTDNFKVSEFDCKDGTPYPPEWVESKLRPLCDALEIIREELGESPIRITSGFRTALYNQRVGGSKRSQHMAGRAADIVVSGVKPREVAKTIRTLISESRIPSGGVGDYSGFTHYDTRGHNARWRGK